MSEGSLTSAVGEHETLTPSQLALSLPGLGESAPSFRAEVNRRGSGGAGLVLDVLPQHGDGCPADRSSEVGARPEPLRTPVVLLQFGELPAHIPAGHPFEAVDEMRDSDLGREGHQQVHMVGFAVELDQFALEVGAHVAEDRFQSGQVRVSEHFVTVLGNENQVRVHGVDHVSTCANIQLLTHETKCRSGIISPWS